jgi:hypothetical protein
MKQLFYNMVYRALGILLVVLTVATAAMAQKQVNQFEFEQCETFEFSVVDWQGDRYTWDLYTEEQWDTVNFATQKGNVEPAAYFDNGMYQGSTVKIHWLDPGRYILRIMAWDEKSCTNNLIIFSVNVLEHIPEATITGDSLCYGDPVVFKIVITGKGKWEAIYTYGDGTASLNLYGENEIEQTVKLPPLPVGTTEVWVQQIIDECSSNLIPSEKGRIFIFPIPTNSRIYPVNK